MLGTSNAGYTVVVLMSKRVESRLRVQGFTYSPFFGECSKTIPGYEVLGSSKTSRNV